MDFTSLKQLGLLEKEVKVAEHTFKLTTLTHAQQEKAVARIPEGTTDERLRIVLAQASILSEAIASIDNEAVADRDGLFVTLKESQYRLIDKLFDEYLSLAAEQSVVLDELKKN